SNHGLRYAYAQDVEKYYLSQGVSPKEAYALTSMDLGHGDGRGDYIKRVYSQKGDVEE
ncbi:DNA-binding protein, partial [Proteus mirabilis]